MVHTRDKVDRATPKTQQIVDTFDVDEVEGGEMLEQIFIQAIKREKSDRDRTKNLKK